jgi:hypothetical protein
VIIECAINGVTSPEKNPNVPRKPDQIAAETFRVLDAGASLIHAHNFDINLSGEEAARDYLAAWQPILSKRPGTLWYPTVCSGKGAAAMLSHIEPILREVPLRFAVLDPGRRRRAQSAMVSPWRSWSSSTTSRRYERCSATCASTQHRRTRRSDPPNSSGLWSSTRARRWTS